ncbi:MAG: tRNA (guanosine(46)-N7)-methyltransferase TrmB [Rickettsiales bacterium]|jgi:tRNA (guanine-N(7)-)-methyltransferase|nr:tRNA (guanosine(46)-N7)-methyltransferase TrmB [Rickettsiales bacterium]
MLTFDCRKNIRSFGRINNRKIGPQTQFLLANVLPKYSLDMYEPVPGATKNYLEIGFGYGESIAARAEVDPRANYIGCETYMRGVANLAKLILTKNLANVHIFNGDARILLERLDENHLDGIFILFPDPWPKQKQRKKRIVNDNFLWLARKKLKNGGILFFASDSREYAESVLKMIRGGNFFTPNFTSLENCKDEPTWWIETKYQKKARELNSEIYFMEFTAISETTT